MPELWTGNAGSRGRLYALPFVRMVGVWLGGENMPLSFCIGFTVIAGLGITCLAASIAVLIKVQELHSRCVDILMCAYNWLEEIHHEPEVKAHEGTD